MPKFSTCRSQPPATHRALARKAPHTLCAIAATTIERRAKRKYPASHLAVLSLESSALQIGALRQPRLIGSAGSMIFLVRFFRRPFCSSRKGG
jgi:hypothetical protein